MTDDSPFAAPQQITMIPQRNIQNYSPTGSASPVNLSSLNYTTKIHLPASFYRPSNTFLVASQNFEDSLDKLTLPKEVEDKFTEWLDKGFVPVTKDQMSCGGCWAFAVCESLSARLAIATNGKWNNPFGLSEQYLISCGSELGAQDAQGCQGGIPQYAIDALSVGGVPKDTASSKSPTLYTYFQTRQDENSSCAIEPGSTCGCSTIKSIIPGPMYTTVGTHHTYTSHGPNNSIVGVDLWPDIPPEIIKKNVERMKKAIYYEGPFTVGIQVTQAFYDYRPAINTYFKNNPSSPQMGGHAVAILGWRKMDDGTPVWICKNSWGEQWGYDVPSGPTWVNPKTGLTEKKYKGGFWNHIMGINDSFIESNAVGAYPNLKDSDIVDFLPNKGTKIPKNWYETMTLRDIYEHHDAPDTPPDESKKKSNVNFVVNNFDVNVTPLKAINYRGNISTVDYRSISNFFSTPNSKYLIVGDENTFNAMIKLLPSGNVNISGDEMVAIVNDIQNKITDYCIIGIKGSMGIFFWTVGNPQEFSIFNLSNFAGRTTDVNVISRILFAQIQSADQSNNIYYVSKKS